MLQSARHEESCGLDGMTEILDSPTAARHIRALVLEMSRRGRAAHLGSALSCADMLAVAYWNGLKLDPEAADDPERDRLILSKGHAAMALYATLALRGFFPLKDLEGFNADGGSLPEHPGPHCAPGVEAATGSLGHGLSLGAGMALAGRLERLAYRVVVIMSDGECNEGSVWEAALFAAAHRLGRLLALVDYNKWQATGRSNEVLALAPLCDKWRSFGWDAVEADGHDHAGLSAIMRAPAKDDAPPRLIVAHTLKGRGVSFMEDDNNWHYRIPTEDEVRRGRKELGLS